MTGATTQSATCPSGTTFTRSGHGSSVGLRVLPKDMDTPWDRVASPQVGEAELSTHPDVSKAPEG